MNIMRTICLLLLTLCVTRCSPSSPPDLAERIGDVELRIDNQSASELRSRLENFGTGTDRKLDEACHEEWGPGPEKNYKHITCGVMVSIWFYGGFSPAEIIVSSPFKGSICGLRIGDSHQKALDLNKESQIRSSWF